jgi:hypothetical protein
MMEGGVEVMGRQGRLHKQLLDDMKKMRKYWKSKEETLYVTVWRTHGYGPVIRQTSE